MRLLYTADDGRLAWTDDLVGDQIPRYAILSHTWGEQEVAYKDLQNYRDIEDVDARLKGGYQKIFFCAAQAKRDGLDYFWVDTCCIIQTHHRRQRPTKRVGSAADNGSTMYVALQNKSIENSLLSALTTPPTSTNLD